MIRCVNTVDEMAEVLCDPYHTTFLYVVQAGDTALHKIGYSRDPLRRFDQIRSLAAVPLSLVGLIPDGDAAAEAKLHRRLRRYRRHGEWFDLEPAALDVSAATGLLVDWWTALTFFAGKRLPNPALHGDSYHRDGSILWAERAA